MKKIFLSCIVLLFTVGLFAQQNVKTTNPAQTITDQLVTKYQLDKKQAAEMLKIQTRKLRNESEIATLKTTDLAKYLAKVESLETGINFSFRKMLTVEQRKIFDQEKHDLRTKRANLANLMSKQGKLPIEIKQATLDIKD